MVELPLPANKLYLIWNNGEYEYNIYYKRGFMYKKIKVGILYKRCFNLKIQSAITLYGKKNAGIDFGNTYAEITSPTRMANIKIVNLQKKNKPN